MKKSIPLLFSYILSLCLWLSAYAADNNIVRTYTGEDSISVYVRGEIYDTNVSAQIGTSEAEEVIITDLKDVDGPIRTLILVDNSFSIPQTDRAKIKQLVSDIADKCLEPNINSMVAIGMISEDIIITCDYTNAGYLLEDAAERIEFYNQETYLTDALAGYVESNFYPNESVLDRIIVISDGVDNRPVDSDKKTPEYLKKILKEYNIPLYAVGCKNKDKSNDTRLMNMKDLAESTPGCFCTLDKSEDTREIANLFIGDFQGAVYEIFPKAEQMDGAIKTVKIILGEKSITVDVRMPQKLEVKTTETEPEDSIVIDEKPNGTSIKTEPEEPEKIVKPAVDEKQSDNSGNYPTVIYILIALACIVFAVIVVLVIVFIKSKNKDEDFEAAPEEYSMDPEAISNINNQSDDQGQSGNVRYDGETIMFWDGKNT